MDLGYVSEIAQAAFLQAFPSTQWANRLIEPYKGLPYGTYLHAARPRRQRSLTAPIDASRHTFWQRLQVLSAGEDRQATFEQRQSLFFSRLPIDIRMIIYEMVLGNMVFHLSAQTHHSRILLFICQRPHLITQAAHECHELPTRRPSLAPREDFASATGLLPLLVACRRIYTEAIHILYSTNTFEFRQSSAAFRFLRTMIPPQRLHSLRHFHLHMRVPHHPLANSRSRRDWQDLFDFFRVDTNGLLTLFLRLQLLQPTEDLIRAEDDHDAIEWVMPMVRMAVAVHNDRGCKVDIMTAGVVHNCVAAYQKALLDTHHDAEMALRHACVEMHRSIRLSLDST